MDQFLQAQVGCLFSKEILEVRYHLFLIFFHLLNDLLKGDTTNRLKENSIGDFCKHSVGLHHDFILKHFRFVGLNKILLAPALSLASHNRPILQLLQRTLNDNHYFLESSHTLTENRLICFIGADLHCLDDFFCLELIQLTEKGIFLESPLDEVLESHIVNLIVEDTVQSIPA